MSREYDERFDFQLGYENTAHSVDTYVEMIPYAEQGTEGNCSSCGRRRLRNVVFEYMNGVFQSCDTLALHCPHCDQVRGMVERRAHPATPEMDDLDEDEF